MVLLRIIPPDQIPLIWDRYYKVDRVHRRAMIGTGLGLSIVKQILEAHRTTYGVESKVGEGSTFWFDMPVEAIVTDDLISDPISDPLEDPTAADVLDGEILSEDPSEE